MNVEEKRKQEEIKKLVIARLDTIPSNVKISIGSEGSFDKTQLINAIKEDNYIGKKMIEIEMEYLKKLKEGLLYAPVNSNY